MADGRTSRSSNAVVAVVTYYAAELAEVVAERDQARKAYEAVAEQLKRQASRRPRKLPRGSRKVLALARKWAAALRENKGGPELTNAEYRLLVAVEELGPDG